MAFATASDLASRWRTLTSAEQTTATLLIADASDALRQYALNNGKDLDAMIDDGKLLPSVIRSVICDIVKRYMVQMADETNPMTQVSESALGYSVSGTYLTPGGGMFIKNAELSRLGLRRQRIGGISLC